jgi:hypothetical protein
MPMLLLTSCLQPSVSSSSSSASKSVSSSGSAASFSTSGSGSGSTDSASKSTSSSTSISSNSSQTSQSSASTSSSTSTSTSSSSSTPVSTGYKLVTSFSDLVAGYSYLIGDAGSGSVHFVGTSTSSSYYLSSTTVTVSGAISTLPTGVQAFTLGGSSGAYTFKGTVSLTNYLASNSSYQEDLLMSASTSANSWDVTVSSGVVTLQKRRDQLLCILRF